MVRTILAGILLLGGCGGGTAVRGTVVHPATIPVRSFPRIWIAGGHLDYEIALLDSLAAHLRGRRAEVHRVELDRLEPLRAGGRIRAATVVVIVDVRMRESTRTEWGSRPETVCGPVGCYQTTRSYVYELPTLRALVSVTVYDGPSARVLQRTTLREADEGRDYDDMRERVVNALRERLLRMVDQHPERVEVVLLDVDVPEVERAIETIDDGEWEAGRQLLEQAWRSPAVRALDPEDRARVLYDIGQARRFDPSTLDDPQAHFEAAERALRAAIRLHAHERYRNALDALQRHRNEVVVVRAQEQAAEHNYRLATQRPPPNVPPPPPSYGQPGD
jgi:hypothetical protein